MFKSVLKAAQMLKDKCHAFVNASAAPFPREVTYPSCCPRGCCICGMSRLDSQFLADILEAFCVITSLFGKPAPATVAEDDLIFVSECVREAWLRYSGVSWFVLCGTFWF